MIRANTVPSRTRGLRRRIPAFLATGTLVLGLLGSPVVQASSTQPEVVSISAVTGQPGTGVSAAPGVSSDGRYVAFHSKASDLVSGDTNGFFDIFVRDRVAGTTERVSVSSTGAQSTGDSSMPSISGDGRYVVFHSNDRKLTPDGAYDGTYLHDRDTHTVERFGLNATYPVLSQDGSTIAAWDSVMTNGQYSRQVVVFDRATKAKEIVSLSNGGQLLTTTGTSGMLGYLSISPDGRFVAYSTSFQFADDPLPVKVATVYVRDRLTQTTTRVSVSSSGEAANGDSNWTAVSPDGNSVVFYSIATNLDGTDPNGNTVDLYRYDMASRTTRRISSAAGSYPYASMSAPTFSADGRYLAFEQKILSGTAQVSAIFRYDMQTDATFQLAVGGSWPSINADGSVIAYGSGQIYMAFPPMPEPVPSEPEVVSISAVTGQPGTGVSAAPGVSSDGRYVAFHSNATDLVSGDTNGFFDIFVRDRVAGTTERVSVSSTGAQSTGDSNMPSISGDGRYVVFHSNDRQLTADGEASGTYLYDRDTHTIERFGLDAINPVLSQDGSTIAAWDCVMTNGQCALQVVVFDRASHAMEIVSLSNGGQQLQTLGTSGMLGYLSISPDGRFVAYSTDFQFADDPLPVKVATVYVRDRLTQTTTRVSVSSSGEAANGDSNWTAVSPDGNSVVFYSIATNLDGTDPNGNTVDLYRYDMASQTTRRISAAAGSYPYAQMSAPTFSTDGRYLAFEQITLSGTAQVSAIFRYHMQTEATIQVAVGGSWPSITADGSAIAYGNGQIYIVSP